MIITIDGPSGTGKSTIAKLVAEKLGVVYFDTGAMYRALTYGILKHKLDPQNSSALQTYLNHFNFKFERTQEGIRYLYENEDITHKIREKEVTALVSPISTIQAVREKLVDLQRALGSNASAVFDGRDMGTHVFPQAEYKFYLDARPEIRAKRRYEELLRTQPTIPHSFEEVLESVLTRDHRDTNRTHSPLKPAPDAYYIDTSNLSVTEVLNSILARVNQE